VVPGSARNWIAITQLTIQHKKETKKMTTLSKRNSIGRSPLRGSFLLSAVALACFVLSPTGQAKVKPDGDLGNGNTAEGEGALFSLTTGLDNTAMGFGALNSNTTGNFNTANGTEALVSNTTGNFNTANGVDALINNTTGNNTRDNGKARLRTH